MLIWNNKLLVMSQELKNRTKAFAVRVIVLIREIRKTMVEEVLMKQLLRSATSVGANYRSALRARSKPDFISKLTIAEEEADESCFWLELLIEAGICEKARVESLLNEAKEITAILTASGRTAKERLKTKN